MYIRLSASNNKIYSCFVIMMFYQYKIFCPLKNQALHHSLPNVNQISPKMTKIFEDVTGGCTSQSASNGFSSYGGLSGVSPTNFILYLNHLPFETLPLTSTSSISFL